MKFRSPLRVTRSVAMTDAILTGSSVPESEHAAYNPATTYAAGARCLYEHGIYESLQADNTGHDPALESGLWWSFVQPTDRWKPFDLSNTTRVPIAPGATVWYEFTVPNAASTLALLRAVGIATVRVVVTTSGVETHNQTYTLKALPSSVSYYAWFFERIAPLRELIVRNLPLRAGSVLRVEITADTDGGSVGTILFGKQHQVGTGVEWGASLERLDFSTLQENPYTGDITLKPRAPAKLLSLVVELDNSSFDAADALLDTLVGLPCLFEVDAPMKALTQWGVMKSSRQIARYYDIGQLDLSVRSFT